MNMNSVIKVIFIHVLLSYLVIRAHALVIKRSSDNADGPSPFSSIADHLPKKLNAINALANNGAQTGHISTIIKNLNEQSDYNTDDAKLTIPGPLPIDIEQIKKIATIIGFIGNQVLPALIDPNAGSVAHDYVENV